MRLRISEHPARPFVKWAGGKSWLALQIAEKIPDSFCGTYHEPFVGGGALFFLLASCGAVRKAQLTDSNLDLIAAYRAVRDNPEALIAMLQGLSRRHGYAQYAKVRAMCPLGLSDVKRGGRAIYLNRTCFNGLWRVNKKGQFNVPMGRYGNPRICDPGGIRSTSAALQKATISGADFDRVWGRAKAGDVVYFDPPYLPTADKESFRSYTRDGFTMEDQERLADLALCLVEAGVTVILTGADTKETRALYLERGFTVETVQTVRRISSDADTRGAIGELLITWENT